ncbi:hypothetical protein TEA_028792 [Camellia sinensis var. sinensis]|uniref:Uncharacterized protein n=1 Tax=Camellia sinensis var. sinensis TaxID=542762 RepID=A0A4S4F200_CAMSN|nr:hypothetical protein TEA_028792 [Camellia sinensis var. sinensis]
MSCTAVTAFQLAVNFKNIYHSSSVPSMLCVTPNHINQFPETYLKLASSGSTYWYRAPVCLFGDKGKSENPNKASPWEALEKAMGRFKKEQSVEDILKQQMEKQEFYDDGGSNGGNRPGGGGGGSGGGDFGEPEDEGFAGIVDEVLQVTLATIGFVFLYIYIIEGEDITRLAQDVIKFVFSGRKSVRLKRLLYEWGMFFQRQTKKEMREDWLECAIITTPTLYDSPEKYERILRSYLTTTTTTTTTRSDDDDGGDNDPDPGYYEDGINVVVVHCFFLVRASEDYCEDVDEDVFLDETLYEEESQVLRDTEEQQAPSSRLFKWKRPALSQPYQSQSQSIGNFKISFLCRALEIDYVIGESHKELLPNSSGPAAIIRIFGVTREGHIVCCHVHGFEPYFYISCPPGMGPDDISHFHQILEGRMREANRNNRVPKIVRRIEMVQRRSIMYYQQQDSQPFLRIVVALPTMITSCRDGLGFTTVMPAYVTDLWFGGPESSSLFVASARILDRGIQIDGLGMKSFMTYESNVLFALRFMIDCNIVGGNWIEVPAGKYRKPAKNLSYCQLEFDCLYSDLISHAPEGEFSKMAPFRILSFDIECAGHKGHFLEPTHDPVIQVANLITLQGQDQPFVRNVMTLNSCSPIVGVDVMSFDTEREVLLAWRRAEVLGIPEFPMLGHIRNSGVRVKDTTFSSRLRVRLQYGTRESKEVTVEGRVQFDLLQVLLIGIVFYAFSQIGLWWYIHEDSIMLEYNM